MKAIGYARVSTRDQAQNGVSLEVQKFKIQAFCDAKDWELITVLADEGHSAKNLNRPGMQQIINGSRKKQFDIVVILKLDRLTRSVKDLGYLVEDIFNKNGIAFSSLQDNFDTSTANGRMVMNMLATIAQWERDIISERTRDAMEYMKSKFRRVGAIPFGYTIEGDKLSPTPDEMITVEKIVSLRNGGLSYQKISDYLNSNKIPAKQGGKWYPKTVKGVFSYSLSVLDYN